MAEKRRFQRRTVVAGLGVTTLAAGAVVAARKPYRSRLTAIVSNRSDPVIRASKGAPGGWLKMSVAGDGGYTGSLTVGVLRTSV